MFTHRSRGIEIIAAVFETGSTVNKIMVSVQSGQSGWLGSWALARKPKKTILIRLPPSHVGACTTGAKTSSVGATAMGVPFAFSTGVPKTLLSTCQLVGGIPSSEVNCQHVIKPRTKIKKLTDSTNATDQNMICRVDGRLNFIFLK